MASNLKKSICMLISISIITLKLIIVIEPSDVKVEFEY